MAGPLQARHFIGQRWFPEKPSLEALDDRMQAGYALQASGAVAACCVWLEAWNDVLRILDKAGMQSIEEFDERFGGSQSLFNWIQDLEGELWNAGLEDRQFFIARIALCEEGLRRFRSDDDLMTENRRRALAAEAPLGNWYGSPASRRSILPDIVAHPRSTHSPLPPLESRTILLCCGTGIAVTPFGRKCLERSQRRLADGSEALVSEYKI